MYTVRRLTPLSVAIAVGLGAPPVVFSQDVIEEITVTARKREETLQDVPFSINALSETQLRNRGATDLETLSNNVAGFSVQNLGPGQSQVAIRGISAGQIVRDQPGVKEQVGVYLDESVISLSLFTPDIDFYDMNRVEVLRGPQGTLFGSGSLSGTVRYITNQPDFDGNDWSFDLGLHAIDDGDFGYDMKGMVNFPFSDTVAFRGVAYYTDYSGFIDAVQPTGVAEDVNDGSRAGVRLALGIEPNESLSITPRLIWQDTDIHGYNRVDVFNILGNPFTTTRPAVNLGDLEQYTQLQEGFEDEFLLADLTVEYDFPGATFTSVTSYTDRDILVTRDATQLTASITAQPTILGLPEPIFTIDAPLFDATEVEVVTQELRLASNGDGPFQWVGGIFYSDIERLYGQTLDVAGFEAATGIPTAGILAGTDILFFSRIPYDFEQIAVFGEVSYDVSDRLTLVGGLRYFDFEENRILNFDGIFADQTIGQGGSTSSDGVSPRVMLSYDINDDMTLNAQVAEGFRLGGINDPLNAPLCSPADLATFGGRPSFDDEELTNYEIGIKSKIMDGAGTFNIAAFYSDIDNLQATLDAGTCSSRIIFNVPEARSLGLEFEFFARPTDNFEFGLTGSWVDAELKSTVTSTDAAGNITVVGGIEDGNRLPTVPETQFAATGTIDFQWNEQWDGFVTGTFQYVGSRFTQIGDQAPGFGTVDLTITPIGDPSVSTFTFDPKLPSYDVGNLRIGARKDNVEVAFFINNIWDERALLALDRERGGRARVGFLVNQPRTYGLTTRFYF